MLPRQRKGIRECLWDKDFNHVPVFLVGLILLSHVRLGLVRFAWCRCQVGARVMSGLSIDRQHCRCTCVGYCLPLTNTSSWVCVGWRMTDLTIPLPTRLQQKRRRKCRSNTPNSFLFGEDARPKCYRILKQKLEINFLGGLWWRHFWWKNKQVLLPTVQEVLRLQKKKKQPLVTNGILDVCDQRRAWNRKRKSTPQTADLYREVNCDIR